MFKTITLLKRRDGMTMADFIAHYETVHARIGEKYLAAGAVHYCRRFLHPLGEADDKPYDVVMEIWFEDRAAFEHTLAELMESGPAAEIAADEDKLFDRSRSRMFAVEEHVSDLAAIRAAQGVDV